MKKDENWTAGMLWLKKPPGLRPKLRYRLLVAILINITTKIIAEYIP